MKPHRSLSFLGRSGGAGTPQPVLGDGDVCAEAPPGGSQTVQEEEAERGISQSQGVQIYPASGMCQIMF